MNSTSSSGCYFTGPFGFGTTFPNIIGNPFCATTRQPLIYYAKIEEPFQHYSNRGNNDNSNCFMRAFQWYTQERGSGHRNENAGSSEDHNDFAAWLDKKYNEYLKGKHQDGSQLVLKQSPTLESVKKSKKKKSARKFGRMRSPWKRRRHSSSKEKGDIVPTNSNKSIEYILQPQDLQKPASECCQRNSRIQSSTTIVSKESLKYTKIKVKSKSLLSIYRSQGVCENKEVKANLHAKNVCKCLKEDIGTQYKTLSLETLKRQRNYNTKNPRVEEIYMSGVITKKYSPRRSSRTNVLCQCSEVNFFETDGALALNKHGKRQDRHLNEEVHSKIPKTAEIYTENNDLDISKVRNCNVQTSDHSINLGNALYGHPLLFQVVHVNK